MFDPKKEIYASDEDIDAIIAIKERIAQELQWFIWDIPKENDKLFTKYISEDIKLNKLKNIK